MMKEDTTEKTWRDYGWPAIVGLVFLVGLGLRIFKAWTGHLSPNADFGIVGLMAKHMAEGRDFSVFFYGQPYMGSLEPAVSAVLCRVFGFSSFMVCIGTALVGALLLPLVYFWGREAGGRQAGLMATLFCLVGSDTLFHFSVAPRGGYMTMMVSGVLSVLLAARIATRMGQGQPVPSRYYLGLGLAAGFAWWSTQLAIAFLLTAALVLLSGFRWRMVQKGLLPAALAFFAGSFPWWLWNARNGWATFEFGGELGRVPVSKGLHSVADQLLKVVELSALKNPLNDIRLVLMVIVLLLFVFLTIRDRTQRENSSAFYFRLAAPLLLALLALTSCTTTHILRSGSSRYVLPAFPALAVMLAVACAWLPHKTRIPIGWIVFVLLIPKHLYEIHRMPLDLAQDKPKWETAAKLADELPPSCNGVCIGDFYAYHWINFASGERLCIADLPEEKYAPYSRRVEFAQNPAILMNHNEIRTFLRSTRGTSSQEVMCGIPVDYGLIPPPDDWRYIDPAIILHAEDSDGKQLGKTLTDAVMDTSWSTVVAATNSFTLTFAFERPLPLCGIRFLSPDVHPQSVVIAVEGTLPNENTWTMLLPPAETTGYFWSGRQVMLDGLQAFQEVRFAAPTGGIGRVRVTFKAGKTPRFVRLGEILFLEQESSPGEDLPSLETCLTALRSKGVRQFYGPRWLSGRVAFAMAGEMSVLAPSSIFRTVNELPTVDSAAPYPVVVRETTGLITDLRNSGRCRNTLAAVGLRWEEIPLGRYILMVVQKPGAEEDAALYPTFYWTEQGCFSADMSRFAITKAQVRYEKARRLSIAGDKIGAEAILNEAIKLYPEHHPARRALIETLEALGKKEEADINAAVLKNQTIPPVSAPIKFSGGIEFLGLGIHDQKTTPVGFVELDYFWKCQPAAIWNRPAMFVHFLKGEEIRFQDDHNLLEAVQLRELQEQPFERVFKEHRLIRVPASASQEEYKITVGLYYARDGKRIESKTDLPQTGQEVTLPIGLNTGTSQ